MVLASRTPAPQDLAGHGDYLAAVMVRSGRKTINAHFEMSTVDLRQQAAEVRGLRSAGRATSALVDC